MSTKSNSEVTKLLDVNASLDKNLTESFKLVERFGTLLKGNQKELDHKLAGLRKAIKQTSTADDLSLHITSVNQSLKGFESEFSTCLRNIKKDMLDIGESLQSIKGMDADLRRNLRMVLNKIKATDSNVLTEIQPNITKLVKILVSIKVPPSSSNSGSGSTSSGDGR